MADSTPLASFLRALSGNPPARHSASTLIIVCCHAIFHGYDPLEEKHWHLAPFQKSEQIIFAQHILLGLSHLTTQDSPLLVFSGGPTKTAITHETEAQSYLNASRLLLSQEPVRSIMRADLDLDENVALEEYATDSFQNVLFSILKYNQIRGTWPDHVVCITHSFKRDRMNLHRSAIRWDKGWEVKGLDHLLPGTCQQASIATSSLLTDLNPTPWAKIPLPALHILASFI